jgi:hypothetical protein
MAFSAAEAAACNARGGRNPVYLVPAGSSSRMASWARTWKSVRFTAWCYGGHVASPRAADWVERVLLAANDINLTSRALISGRFYTCTNAFQMLQ